MKKSKYKIKKAQAGRHNTPIDLVQGDNPELSNELEKRSLLKQFYFDHNGFNDLEPYRKAGYDITANNETQDITLERPTGQYDFNPYFKGFNALAELATGVLGKIEDVKSSEDEYKQYLKALQPVMSESTTEEGLNNIPVYTKYGGKGCKNGCGEVDHKKMHEMMMKMMDTDMDEMKKGGWIQGAIKHPGRCSNPGDSRCPEGSPQYNLAMRFKHGDLHKAQTGGSFGSAFANARKAGLKIFEWNGKKYTTQLKEEVQPRTPIKFIKKAATEGTEEPNQNYIPQQSTSTAKLKFTDATSGTQTVTPAKNITTNKPSSKLESGVVVDKRTNQAYVIQNGKIQKQFPVLTGQNKEGNIPHSYQEREQSAANRTTPTGTYLLNPNPNLYGFPGFDVDNIDKSDTPLAVHTTYDPAYRNQFYGTPNANKSYGCINCQRPDIDYLNKTFPKGDTLIVIDSKTKTLNDLGLKRPYGGGPLTAEGAKEILRDGTIHGKKLTEKQRKYFGYIAGGGKPKAEYGYEGAPLIEAEKGEVYQDTGGGIFKVPESAPTHEGGGAVLNNVSRVLEDTSDKRKDYASQALKLQPDMVEFITGVKTNSPLSHSKAFEKGKKYQFSRTKKLERALTKNADSLDQNPLNKFASNSMDLNLMTLKNIPTQGEMFDELFDHQEFVKGMAGIDNEQQMKKGGKNKKINIGGYRWGGTAQYGLSAWKGDRRDKSNASKYSDEEWNQFAKELGFTGKGNRAFQEFLFNQNGDVNTMGDIQSEILNLHNKYGEPINGMFDSKLGHRWDIVLDNYRNRNLVDNNTPIDASAYNPTTRPDNIASTPVPQRPTRSINPLPQPTSRFNEPLNWYDVAGPISQILENRIPVKYNPAEFNQIRLKQQNPLPSLQNAQADYNAAIQGIKETQGSSGAAIGNIANVFSTKYNIDNQVLGNYENINTGIKNQELLYNANVRDRQSVANQQARAVFENQRLGSIEAERQSHLTGWDDLYTRLALNRKLNREGNLLMKLFPAFNQNADYNGYRMPLRMPIGTIPPDVNTPVPVSPNRPQKPAERKFVTLSNGKKIYLD